MKLLDIDWTGFINKLDSFQQLPIAARLFFVDQVKPSAPVPKGAIAQFRDPLIASGLMVLSPTGTHASVHPECRDFSRAIRAMARNRVFVSPSRDTFQIYLNDNLTTGETAALYGPGAWGRLDYHALQRVYSSICSVSWPKEFLAAKNPDWERDYMSTEEPPYFHAAAILKAAQRIVASVAETGPVRLARIPELCPDLAPDIVSGALRAAFRYLLLFPFLDRDDLQPMVGLWPGLGEKLLNKAPAPPAAVAVAEPFHSPFLMEDMMAILSACAIEPIRLRSGDMEMFAAARESLTETLGTLPEWIEASFAFGPDARIELASVFLRSYGYLKQSGRPGSDFRLEVTESGAQWLALPGKDRLRMLLDGLRGSLRKEASLYADGMLALVPGLSMMGSRVDSGKLVAVILGAFAGVAGDVYVRLADFLNHQAKTNNGLASIVRKDRYFSMRIGAQYITAPSDEEIETAWKETLYNFLHLRLLPLGGVRVGIEASGKAICFLLTDAGRYLLGAVRDFDVAGDPAAHVLIQPNFDVVFLSPSARVEAELARICERKGRHVGTLFRITKTSILAAAATGLTRERILQTLREHCASAVPPNVEAEIIGWFGRYRQVNVRPATIIHCPDADTAARVMAAMGRKVTRLSDTALELHEPRIQAAVAKKLREAGIFIRG